MSVMNGQSRMSVPGTTVSAPCLVRLLIVVVYLHLLLRSRQTERNCNLPGTTVSAPCLVRLLIIVVSLHLLLRSRQTERNYDVAMSFLPVRICQKILTCHAHIQELPRELGAQVVCVP